MKGFTILELVVIMVVVSILAAASLPKISTLTTKGKDSSELGIIRSFEAAVNIAHSSWISKNKPPSVTLEDSVVFLSTEGYPEYTLTAGASGVMTNSKCLEVYNGVFTGPKAAIACTGTCKIKASGATSICNYDFEQGQSGKTRLAYNITNGSTTTTTTP